MKRNLRLSRFSQNVNLDLIKNLQLSFERDYFQERQNNISVNLIESLVTSKRSLFNEQKGNHRSSKFSEDNQKQPQQQNLQEGNQNSRNKKYFDADQVKKYKKSLIELNNLYQKPKKQKNKHIYIDFIHFLFQILKNQDFITKVLNSYVPHESILNQFVNILNAFQTRQYNTGSIIQINKSESQFFILVEGAAQKLIIKQTKRQSLRNSVVNNESQSSIFRKSKKNKTVTEKGKITCFQSNNPIFINQESFNVCSIKVIGKCIFILIQKNSWNKFLTSLQKLQQKCLVNFIKHCTTINLNICTQKQNQKDENRNQGFSKKTFLFDLKNPQFVQADSSNEQIDIVKLNLNRKSTVYGNSLQYSYKLINIYKDQSININNEDVYLLVKGSLFLETQFYSIIINQGSIINSSILLLIIYSQVKIKSLVDCLIVKLFLNQIYFRKQDEQEFIKKLNQIQNIRKSVYGEKIISNKNNSKLSKVQHQFKESAKENYKIEDKSKQQESRILKSKFEPKQLLLKDIDFNASSFKKLKTHKRQRIGHLYQNCQQNNLTKNQKQHQVMKEISIKYANNYCIFQKIVQSQEKVIQKYKLNRVKKLFPIQALLKNLNFKKNLETVINSSSKNHTIKKVNFNKIEQSLDEQKHGKNNITSFIINQLSCKKRSMSKSSKASKRSCKNKKEKEINLKQLSKRRQKYKKSRLQRKKKQKANIIDNLFELKLQDELYQRQNSLQGCSKRSEKPTNISLDFHKQRIKNIVDRNNKTKLKELQSERNYILFKGNEHNDTQLISQVCRNNKKNSCQDFLQDYTNRIKLNKRTITEPTFNFQFAFSKQKIISPNEDTFLPVQLQLKRGKNNQSKHQNNFSNQFIKRKNKMTKTTLTKMYTGLIRNSRNS